MGMRQALVGLVKKEPTERCIEKPDPEPSLLVSLFERLNAGF